MSSKDSDNNTIMPMGRVEINPADFIADPDTSDLPVIATRNLVLFPGVTIPISLTREASLEVARVASEKHIPVGIVCQTDPETENPKVTRSLFRYGVVADVYQVIEMPDGSHTAIIHGRGRFRILGAGAGAIIKGGLSARVKLLSDTIDETAPEFDETMQQVTALAAEIAGGTQMGDMSFPNVIKGIPDAVDRLHFIATNFPIEAADKIKLLSQSSVNRRALDLLAMLMTERERLSVARDVMEKAGQRMKSNQRSTYLQMQLDAIKEELYGTDENDDFEELSARAKNVLFPDEAREVFEKELNKLRRLNPSTPDYSVQYAYLETMLELPWKRTTPTNNDIKLAREILENDHYGLDKIKQRILEQIAVIINNPQAKAPIICLVGPPGVGKTSLGKSIARAMGRKYARVALGGLHDEAEIRGHRRTYIGAMPGRIIKAMKTAATANPVLLLDEIDKIGQDYKGDPSSALLEVLDPEQNVSFHDNYIDIDYDLSDVLFIATANSIAGIEGPLLDRMEVIDLSGYVLEEKMEITRRHLIHKVLRNNGLWDDDLPFSLPDATLVEIIEKYTAESGVRQLEKQLSALVRKYILAGMENGDFPKTVEPSHLKELLGLPVYHRDKYEGNDFPGVVTGLAWTQAGGEILLAEVSLSPGKGDRLTVTGNLGDVMKESATIALQWVKANSDKLGIAPEKFDTNNVHVHFPEGAIPKDGPSAGITIATALTSAFTGRKVAERLAMTGEITLRGRVLPVGGIKEKILAAKRAGIRTIVLSADNRRDVEEINPLYRDGLEFVYVDRVSEVIDNALI